MTNRRHFVGVFLSLSPPQECSWRRFPRLPYVHRLLKKKYYKIRVGFFHWCWEGPPTISLITYISASVPILNSIRCGEAAPTVSPVMHASAGVLIVH